MRSSTPSLDYRSLALRPAGGADSHDPPRSLLLSLSFAVMVALFLALSSLPGMAQNVVEKNADTLEVRTKKTFPEAEVEVEVRTDAHGRPSGIIIHGDPQPLPEPWETVRSDEIVRIGENVVVAENQTVDGDVVAVFGDVTVYGRVMGDAVSVMGRVRIKGNGVVAGDAVGIGGGVDKEGTARLGGQNVGVRFIPGGILDLTGPSLGAPLMGVSLAFASLLFFFLIGWLILVLGEKPVQRVGTHIQEQLWKSLFTGLAAIILGPFAVLLLLVTVVGIPLALLLPVALPLAHLLGFLVVSALVGMRLVGRDGSERSHWTLGLAVGLFFFMGIIILGQLAQVGGDLLHFFGVILTVFGMAAIFVAATIGLGALILSRLGMGPRKSRDRQPKAPNATPSTGAHPLTTS